jgi:AAHS family 4-hydroxybenzoate transporter-like MFS transporter
VVGGVIPLALLPVIAGLLPESARYLVTRGLRLEQVKRVLGRIAPQEDLASATFVVAEPTPAGFPVARLFDAGLRRGTLLLWLAFFMSLLVIYLLSSWLPTLIHETGLSLADAALVTATFQVGGTVGAIALGRLMDRGRPERVLGVAYLLAAGFTAWIGSSAGHVPTMVLAVFGAGFCVSGAQVGANALAAAFYPTGVRATGVSWACGIGRIGSVLGSMGGGAMLALGWGLPLVFAVVGLPAVVAGAAMLAFGGGKAVSASNPAVRFAAPEA